MYQEQVLPILRNLQGQQQQVIASRILRVFGVGESSMEMQIKDIIQQQSNPTVAPYASEGEAVLRLTAAAPTEADAMRLIAPVEQLIRERLGDAIYGIDDETLPVKAGNLLREKGQTLVTAESCTGGMIGSALTDLPGSSDFYFGGFVTYHNDMKQHLLGVEERVLREQGAVSQECAKQMAAGARAKAGTDWAISVTGIAGPGGATETKPVGLVYIGVSGPSGTTVTEHRMKGDRHQIRLRAVKTALHGLIQRIQNER
jgi:nicotinamide-nucleotide amidase